MIGKPGTCPQPGNSLLTCTSENPQAAATPDPLARDVQFRRGPAFKLSPRDLKISVLGDHFWKGQRRKAIP